MAKQHNDQDLFNLELETQDIELPGDLTLQVPVAPKEVKEKEPKQEDTSGNQEDESPSISMPPGDTPPLLAVDLQPGEVAKQGTVSVTPSKEDKSPQQQETEKETEKETVKEKTEPPATQGQQGTGKNTETEEKTSPTYLHAAALHEAGILPNLDLEALKDLKSDEIVDKLLDANRQEVVDQAKTLNEQYKSQFNDEQKRVLDMIDDGVPFDDAANVVYNQLRYDTLTEAEIKENPEVQKQLIKEFLYSKGHNDNFINSHLKQAEDLEKLEEDSLTAHKDLRQMAKDDEAAAKETAKTQAEERKRKNQESLEKIKTDVTNTKQILEGVELTKADQDSIMRIMTVPAGEAMIGGQKRIISQRDEIRMKNPLEFEKRLAYLIHLGYFGDNPKLDKIEKAGETKAVNKLKEILESPEGAAGGKPAITKKDIKKAQGQEGETPFVLPGSISSVRHNE